MRPLAALGRWFFHFGRADSWPLVLTQGRVFIVPTRAGLAFAVVLLVMLLGAINYDLSLGHALVFLLAGLALVAMLHTFRNLVHLRLSPGRAAPVFAGETAFFPLFVENTRGRPSLSLELAFGRNARLFLDLPPGVRASAEIPCPAPRRGRLEPGRVTFATRYPLGLFYAWSYLYPPFSCLVYPRPRMTPLPLPQPVPSHGDWSGEAGQEDFSGLRQRQANDSPRHIAWKAAARDFENRPLLIKQFDGGAAAVLWLEWGAIPSGEETETRLSILAGWVVAAERAAAPYGLRLPGREITPARGDAHYHACLAALADYGT